ncbi:TIGR02680 family protein [Actinomadura sp. DC4]|uniref:TIGR02680 family protein n=1 Tax=Actinomadura sp. DC4 TaxID=3055069 RepID=UPI0025B068C0|nr:TIGR02680 family protein [Actinomadura sp. DC4]MDN3357958.1 TIGR02680 family protein [Actinomadura sp. DC4]
MTARFRPSRAGVINVWDYADEEFVFADGRLVLRGHNGSGKTKALEVLFPFVFDGVADARRLDPFSGDNRTMKSNLLYRGQEAEYGYVWMEFADGEGETVTLVIGLRAHRNRDGVRSSFFVTGKRVGVDFGLLGPDSRPLTDRQLREVLEPGAAYKTATEYRDAVDARLFGLGRERYTQLLDLLLALRRPLLAKDLDPGKVSDTLTAGLSPVDEDLVDQAARDFENLAAVQRLFDDLTAADGAVTAFMADYTTYLQVHAKAKLDRVQAGLDGATGHAHAIAEALAEVARAGRARDRAAAARDAAEAERTTLGARLTALKSHDAYRKQGDLDRMRTQIAATEAEIVKERARLARAGEGLRQLTREADEAEKRRESARADAGRWAAALEDAAERAGITSDGDGPADTGEDLLVAANARGTARRDDVAHVRTHLTQVGTAETDRARAEGTLAEAGEKLRAREASCAEADEHLASVRRAAAESLAAWATRWPEVAEPAGVSALAAALDRIGEADAPSLLEVFAERSDDRRLALASHRQSLAGTRERLGAELSAARAARAAVEAERDDAPQAGDLRTADRTDRPGAPLWRLVRFADGVGDERAAGIEGALYGAGMLTAWIHPDPSLTSAAVEAGESDGYLVPASEPAGRTLADVLVPEEQDLVPAAAIAAVLRSVALVDAPALFESVPAVTDKAQFSHGVHVGARPKPAPEFIGATNRSNRRRARLAAYDESIAKLESEDAEAAAELSRLETLLAGFKRAQRELPAAGPLIGAVKRVADHAILLTVARTTEAEARKTLEGASAEVDARRRRLRQAAAERGMPATADAVDTVAQAVEDFAAAAGRLDATRQNATFLDNDVEGRRAHLERLRVEQAEDAETLSAKEKTHGAAVEELAERERALDAPLKEVLAQISEIEKLIETADGEFSKQQTEAAREDRVLVNAEADLRNGRKLVAEAMSGLFEQASSFAPYTHRDLRVLLGVKDTRPWPADATWAPDRAGQAVVDALSAATTPAAAPATAGSGPVDPAAAVRGALPDGVFALLEAFRAEVGGGRPVAESTLKSAAGRMSDALRTFGDALASCEADYRLDYDPTGVVMVFVIDEDGRNPVAVFSRRVAERAREQGVLLEDRERTVLEDELLTGLAQQIHGRVLAARDLVRGMNTDTRSRPMSSGTAIGIRWAHSDKIDERQRAISRLLARDAQSLGPSGLTQLRGGLREMIRAYRADHPRATYKEVLAEVLDYRTWHTFELLLVVPGETEVRLTRARHSVMSGGEKSAAIHLPLFAAANALYSSANPDCPRMIALDEAFAGIDDKYKPDLLGLTVKFDLDLFMTGHDLWVHYDTVPMAAHYDMHHDKTAHAVSAMLVLWDGVQLLDAAAGFAGNDELAEELLGVKPSRHAPLVAENTLLTLEDDEEEPEA